MLTQIQIEGFEAAGRRAARAVDRGDMDGWHAERDWLARLTCVLSPADRREAKRAWNLAYCCQRGVVARLGYGVRWTD